MMRDANLSKFGIVLVGFVLLTLLAACAPFSTTGPQAISTVTANSTNSSPATILTPTTGNSPGCTMIAGFVGTTLSKQIINSENIFQGEIVKIEPFFWNTADGNPPAGGCQPTIYQYAPVEVKVGENYKGNLQASSTVKLLLYGAPGAQPYMPHLGFFPKVGEPVVWFLGDNRNYREGSSQNPLYYPHVVNLFHNPGGKEWNAGIEPNSFKDISELKALIKNPLPDPTPRFPKTTQAVLPSPTQLSKTNRPCPTIAADYNQVSLDERIMQAEQIFIGEVEKVDPFVWNTPDGNAPADPCVMKNGSPAYQQLAPIHIIIRGTYKGNLQPGSTIILLAADFPGALPAISAPRIVFPVDAPVVWFLGKEYNYRPGTNQIPLKAPAILEALSQTPGGIWTGGIASPRFENLSEIKARITNLLLTPTPK